MVVATDAELTSARPPTIAIAFANHFVFFIYLCSQLVTIYYNTVRSLCFHSVFLSYASRAPRDSHIKWRHNSFPLKTQYAGGCPPFKPSARLKVVVASLSRALRVWRW
jgi:hypothetical protein